MTGQRLTSAAVGALRCQRDSLARTLTTRVVSVAKVDKPASGNVYAVTLEDTVFFPEGGGQPCDLGTIAGRKVVRVQREGVEAVHHVAADTSPWAVGETVAMEIDWPRRWDAMQQHSGQHLLSALAETHFLWDTASWAFGAEWSSVEFAPRPGTAARAIAPATLLELEDMIAAHIARGLSVTVDEHDSSDAAGAHVVRGSTENLPEDLRVGGTPVVVRTVKIEGVDANPCCGTHISNTAQLGSVILHPTTERVRGKNTRVFFAFGDRVRTHLRAALVRDAALTAQLSCGPTDFVNKVQQTLDAARVDRKRAKLLSEELARELAPRVVAACRGTPVRFHRDGAGLDFLLAISLALKTGPTPDAIYPGVVLTATDSPTSSSVVIVGAVEAVFGLSKQALDAVAGLKGGGGKGKPGSLVVWQGRAPSLEGIDKLALPCVNL